MTALGRVVLLGAGPGAPDLITVRGERLLRQADVVVYDALASPELLALAPAAAERINVGKRGHDAPTRSQEDIHALLVERARAGRLVVRLKGGDPFVFGRGGEEATACLEAGVPVEFVPGVSAALAAPGAAGIPLTDRRHAASFAVVTGHKDPTRVRENIDWAGLARSVDTLVVLMGMRNLEEIVERLLAAGRAPDTPAAVVMHGTLAAQRVVEAPLASLARAAADAGLSAPAAVVVGDVVRLRSRLRELVPRPLLGVRVLVTRSPAQAAPWVVALEEAGASLAVIPMIRVEAIGRSPEIESAFAALAEIDVVVLTSANAARELGARAAERGVDLAAALPARVLCVGPATARAAAKHGLACEPLPERFDAEALLETLVAGGAAAGRRFLLPGSDRARPTLSDGLRRAGARVDAVALYRTLRADFDAEELRGRLVRGDFDALTFASPSAVGHFVGALDPAARAACRDAVVVAIGPVTAEALRGEGLGPDAVAERAEAPALVEAVARAVRERRESGGRGGTP